MAMRLRGDAVYMLMTSQTESVPSALQEQEVVKPRSGINCPLLSASALLAPSALA